LDERELENCETVEVKMIKFDGSECVDGTNLKKQLVRFCRLNQWKLETFISSQSEAFSPAVSASFDDKPLMAVLTHAMFD
jgi:hypothetical protein